MESAEEKSHSSKNKLKGFQFGRVIGKGAFATVRLARYKNSKMVVAMKEIPSNLVITFFKGPTKNNVTTRSTEEVYQMLKNETDLLNRIKSPNVISCYEIFEENDSLYFVLEYCDGGDVVSLFQRMQEAGRLLSERSIWWYFYQICNGLKDMHDQRILHKDLKPANIFLTSKGKVKIGDLGYSCILDDKVYDKDGTEYYMAPERNGTDGYDFKSDIWSLGCILYEFCTFRSPFYGEQQNIYSLHKKINEAKFLPFPTEIYSRQLNFFMIRCLSMDPQDRPSAVEAKMAAKRMFDIFENLWSKHKKSMKSD